MITAKIGRRGQIVLPRAIRERLALKEGQRLAFVIREGRVTLEPLTTTLLDHFGAVPVEGPQDFDAVRRAAQKRKAQKIAQEGRPDDA